MTLLFALACLYLGGFLGALIHFREESKAAWLEAIGAALVWPYWLVLMLWRF